MADLKYGSVDATVVPSISHRVSIIDSNKVTKKYNSLHSNNIFLRNFTSANDETLVAHRESLLMHSTPHIFPNLIYFLCLNKESLPKLTLHIKNQIIFKFDFYCKLLFFIFQTL